MPVQNPNTPSVTVNVPVPTPAIPAAPAKPKRQVNSPVSRGTIVDQNQAPVPPLPEPAPHAIILPWVPTTGKQRKQRRLPQRVIRLSRKLLPPDEMLPFIKSSEQGGGRVEFTPLYALADKMEEAGDWRSHLFRRAAQAGEPHDPTDPVKGLKTWVRPDGLTYLTRSNYSVREPSSFRKLGEHFMMFKPGTDEAGNPVMAVHHNIPGHDQYALSIFTPGEYREMRRDAELSGYKKLPKF